MIEINQEQLTALALEIKKTAREFDEMRERTKLLEVQRNTAYELQIDLSKRLQMLQKILHEHIRTGQDIVVLKLSYM